MNKPRVLVACSGGGAVFDAVAKAFGHSIDFYLFADRPCGAVDVAQKHGIPFVMCVEKDKALLSKQILIQTQKIKADLLLCYFARLLVSPLIDVFPCYNVHPAVLPKYPGMGGERLAYEAQDSEIGATLHLIDAGVDTGEILYQSWSSLGEDKAFERYRRLAHIAKTKVSFCFFEELLRVGEPAIQGVGAGKKCEIQTQTYQEKFSNFMEALD